MWWAWWQGSMFEGKHEESLFICNYNFEMIFRCGNIGTPKSIYDE